MKRVVAVTVVAFLSVSLTSCAASEPLKAASAETTAVIEPAAAPTSTEAPYIQVEPEDSAVQGIFAKDLIVCMETLAREYLLTDLKERSPAVVVTAGNGWCGPDHSTGYGLLFRVQAKQGHVIDFNLFNPEIGEPSVNARDKTEGNEKVWDRKFSVGQVESFYIGGRTFEVERLPDSDRKEFKITLTS